MEEEQLEAEEPLDETSDEPFLDDADDYGPVLGDDVLLNGVEQENRLICILDLTSPYV